MSVKKINIAWAPNLRLNDFFFCVWNFLRIWRWNDHKSILELECKLSSYLGQKVYGFDSGRSALFAILEAFGINSKHEVALQAFTCVALPNPIVWTGATPVWIDIELSNFNLDIEDLEKKITPKTKAIIVQYTFGIAPDIGRIKELCSRKKILLIEDCCHSLGQEIFIEGQKYKAGTIGDAAIFSFGNEKVLSGTRGGFATINMKVDDADQRELRLQEIWNKRKKTRIRDQIRQALNPILLFFKARGIFIGEKIAEIAQKYKILELGLTKYELKGLRPGWLPGGFFGLNAALASRQFDGLNEKIEHRKKIASLYYEQEIFEQRPIVFGEKVRGIVLPQLIQINKYAQATWLRVPIIVEEPAVVLKELEKEDIYLGNWYTSVIHCEDVDLGAFQYRKGSCPKAEWLAQHVINLPTHINIKNEEVSMIVKAFRKTKQALEETYK